MRRGRIHLLLLCWLAAAFTPWEGLDARTIRVRADAGDGAITRAVAQTVAGDTVLVAPGVYRGERIRFPRSGATAAPITLKASAPGVVVAGSQIVTGWSRLPGRAVYRKDGWTKAFHAYDARILANPTSPAAVELDARYRARNQLFVDGLPLEEVPVRRYLRPGTFFVNTATRAVDLYLADAGNPNARRVEVADTEGPLLTTAGQSYIRIEGIGFQHGANPPQDDALVQLVGGQGCELIACSVSYAAGAGVSISGRSHRIERCAFNRNGQLGLHFTRAVGCTVTDSETSLNNAHPGKRYDVGWEAGGLKISRSRSFLLNRHLARHNVGAGIWFDIDNRAATITGCTSHHNGVGIHYEISYTALIANNVCFNNNTQGQPIDGPFGQGIYISSSAGCRVFHNTCYGNGTRGIEVAGPVRGDGAGRTVAPYSNYILNNLVVQNQRQNPNAGDIDIAYVGGDARPALRNPLLGVRPNRLDFNLYFRSDGLPPFRRSLGRRLPSLTAWQAATGQDTHAVWADPRLANPARGDFRLPADSPAVDRGAAVAGVGADYAGGARPRGAGPDIGALEAR